jgi:DNA topoisomerase II
MPKPKTIEQRYQKKDLREHILDRPDSYIGSIEPVNEELWIYNSESLENKPKMIKKNIRISKGLYKIFDEILVNARDHSIRDNKCDMIKVNINKETNMITVWNNGEGVPVEIHKEHNLYVPELIFGVLLTGENYDDNEDKIVGGKNGYGAKLTNIYSKEFIVETVYHNGDIKRKFMQTHYDNMTRKDKAKVTNLKTANPKTYTSISFVPDLTRFGLTELTDDIVNLFRKRVYDIAACCGNKIKVYLDDKLIKENNFKSYVNMYYEEGKVIYEQANDRWEIGVIYIPDDGFEQISFVNGICTTKGGKHVEYVMDKITKKLSEKIEKKLKEIKLKNTQIKEHLKVFVNCAIVNPKFGSQTKDELETISSKFGSKCSLSDGFINKLSKTGIQDQVVNLAKFKQQLSLKKSDGKKVKKVNIPKLEDANKAGTKLGHKCKLILTEGDSAKAFAMGGISAIENGKDYYGIFPLKGKLLNVRDVSAKALEKNEEISNIKKIIGLKQNMEYKDISDLRYGGIVLLTDQDVDGFHIKGLLINFIQYFWPSLINLDSFIYTLATPIVKCNKKNEMIEFYNLNDYVKWKENLNNLKSWNVKYYKGLGTSSRKEAQTAFTDIESKLLCITQDEDEKITNDVITLAFDKKRADDRKKWLTDDYDRNIILDYNNKRATVSDMINKEMVHFSFYDSSRSIPSLCDGLKTSQRKILYTAFYRKLYNKEIKVAQLASAVSELTDYHHGEESLNKAIISMARNFVGSNNINLLCPNGQFGTRVEGGKDYAAPRYIFTRLEDITSSLFIKDDEYILNYLDEDGKQIEPEYYIPILPTILINGVKGIGTGFSTNIPNYNPKDIINNIYRMMENKEVLKINPWYRNFKGDIIEISDNKYEIRGKYNKLGSDIIEITELPIGTWTEKYKDELIKMDEAKEIELISNNSSDIEVNIHIKIKNNNLLKKIDTDEFYKKLKLLTTITTSNMHLFDKNNKIKKYDNVNEIIKEFYELRIETYKKRKEYLLEKYERELNIYKYKIKFIKDVINGDIYVFKNKKSIKKSDVHQQLENAKYPKLSLSGENDSYDYTDMSIYNLTKEEIDKLKKKYDELELITESLRNKTETDLWREELDNFEKSYEEWFEKSQKEIFSSVTKKSKKNKKK